MGETEQQQFFDRAYSEGTRKPVSAFYSIDKTSKTYYQDYLAAHAPGRKVLEYGCGRGSFAFFLAQQGAEAVVGIDISETGIEQARQKAAEEGLENARFHVMNAEAMDFEDGSFDVVCGTGILHHLDLEKAFSEISRVLVSEGSAIFIEPMGHNPAINLFRKMTPQFRVEDEHPLTRRDLQLVENYFEQVTAVPYHLFTLLAVPFRKQRRFPSLLNTLNTLDRKLFDLVPGLGLLAWQVIIIAEKSEKAPVTNDHLPG